MKSANAKKQKNRNKKVVSTENVTHIIHSDTFNAEHPEINDDENNYQLNTKDHLGITASIAIMEPATESQSSRVSKQPLKSHPSNKIKVLLDSGSNVDLYFLPKGKDRPFPYLTRQVPKSWHLSNGSFQTMEGQKSGLNSLNTLQAGSTFYNQMWLNMTRIP